jgi:group II intron reverse transcriptase/maturase
MEGRGEANGKSAPRNASRAQDRIDAPTSLERIGQRAAEDKEIRFSNLYSHIKVPLLKWAYQRLRKKAAPGVDGETWSTYGENLDARLLDLQDRVQRGAYHPLPVRRVHIPKTLGSTRPIGIPTLEDKIVQQAVRAILEPIYESMFKGFSYGFRPSRSPHDALDALAVAIGKRTSWVLDADIRSYFDTLKHDWMKKFVEHRIGDKRLVRLLMKWLQAGVMEGGKLHATEEGSAQGGIISPLMSNIYLHYVLDLWAHGWRTRFARKEVYIVRYADDFVMCFEHEQDALSMRHALRERLEKFGLELHQDKTRLIRFGRYAREQCEREGTKPETFDFLGFTHVVSRGKNGWFKLLRHTSKKKRVAKYAALREEIRRRRHAPVQETWTWLNSVLRGHYAYYGVPRNGRALARFRAYLRIAWFRQLQKRSQRGYWSRTHRARFKKRCPPCQRERDTDRPGV